MRRGYLVVANIGNPFPSNRHCFVLITYAVSTAKDIVLQRATDSVKETTKALSRLPLGVTEVNQKI